ncbi:hypothetical protein [Herbaspirillum sp. SJZ107]|uniref:hypothetical protein n=1 Tax=Herbaspirillum sp. SJZ107 TaxID=2572881 RepID=UPI0011539382|nr:hypothetical protein [Herbaspirillum sp. SJZ107]
MAIISWLHDAHSGSASSVETDLRLSSLVRRRPWLPFAPTEHLDQLERNPFNEEFFERFVARVIGYLEDTARLKRLAEPFISGGMPEIWEDVQAYQDFRVSFFDYLDRAARLPNKPKVARIILERLDVDAPLGGEEEWAEVFGEFLKENGWTDEAWVEHA